MYVVDHILQNIFYSILFYSILLLGIQGSLANADSDAVVGDGVSILKRLHVEIFFEVVDHLLKFPVGVRGVPVPRILLHHGGGSSPVSSDLGTKNKGKVPWHFKKYSNGKGDRV